MPAGASAGQGRQILPLQASNGRKDTRKHGDCLQISLAVCMGQGVPW